MKQLLLTFALMLLAALPLAAGTPQWKVPTYTMEAREMDVKDALDTFGVAQGIPVVFSEEAVAAPFSGSFKDVPAAEFLDKVATISNLTWYFDGTALYIYSAGEVMSTLQGLKYVTADEICAMLRELGVEDERFPLKAASDGRLLLVSGPPRYVTLVTETIEKADEIREQSNMNEIEVRLFPLKHTWADDVDFTLSGNEGSVKFKGVATLLKDMMGTTLEDGNRDAKADAAGNADGNGGEASSKEQLAVMRTNKFQPVIQPDSRMNAVLIRDAAMRMPLYERIIAELDRPQRVVEVTVTLLELNRDDALDWQLSLRAGGRNGDKLSGAGGQNVGTLFSPDALGGSGLSGAVSYLGHSFQLEMSLTALKKNHRARSISRTMLLTLNNMSAEISDMKTFHAKVTGKEVVSFEEVSAGTRLQLRPRVVPTPSAESPWLVWLTMELQDGGFDAISVDDMPMSSTSGLTTQAAVYDGDSLLLAGYMRDIDEEMKWGIPLLRDIPWIGWLFGGLSTQKTTIQRMFILTPHVIDIDAEGVVLQQARRQRDITEPDKIQQTLEETDVERKIRETELDAAIRHQEEDGEEELKRVEFEIQKDDDSRELERQRSDDELRRDKADWKVSIDGERELYKLEKEALEKAEDAQ